MKRAIIKFCCAFALLILACCEKKEEAGQNQQNAIPEALKDEGANTMRFKSRNENLVDQLYQELVDKSPELQSLEKEIEGFNPNDSLDGFHNYDMKSRDYYLSAGMMANRISDTITKNKILALIKKSKENQMGRTQEINELLNTIRDKKTAINDYHSVLKIALTLPIIEQYQSENLPGKKRYLNIVKKEDSIINATQKFIPKNQ